LNLDHLEDLWWPRFEETELALKSRSERFRQSMIETPDWRSVAVVTHWGFIRALTGTTVGNCAVLRIDPERPAEPQSMQLPGAVHPAPGARPAV
jgi:broad specificity phosphatase PhoE